ncbi:DcrB-related protein [Trujillonella endophytica]|uniref:Uncharacterized protein n=1 Tax=Trujillonella endophytica TaxID=673521 RepID=A0A1H8W408_9ACTN|nr:DcrB-related protein [Trujillella endophytica]SEP22369.1 protein of unknown function [Trujillella endophytica]
MTEQQWTDSRLRVRVPEGWSVRESWTLVAPDAQANVVVAREPLPPAVRTEQYAQGLGDRLGAEFPNYQQHVLTVVPLSSGPAYARLFSWAPPGGARVVQVQVCATTPGTGFTATAAAPAASFEYLADTLDGVLRSLGFGAAPAAQPPATAPPPAPEPPAPEQPAAAPVLLTKPVVSGPVEPEPAPEPPPAEPEPEPEPEPEQAPGPVEPEPEPEPAAAEEPPPAAPPGSGSGSTSATVLVQLPRLPPGPPPPPRPPS